MILIDGSDSGGQLVRTACALSAITGKPFKITNIRSSRPNPGLQTQHTEGIKSIAILCNAESKGLELNSKELEFYPKELTSKDMRIEISTAGSIGLVLQAVLLVTSQLKESVRIEIEGGATWGKWAPPVLYLKNVLLPLIGDSTEIKVLRDGFYPKGGGKVEVVTKPLKLKPIEILEKGEFRNIKGFSIASKSLEKSKVAERQTKTSKELIKLKLNKELDIETDYVDSLSPGSGVLILIKTENSIIGGDSLGEVRKSSEDVTKEAVKNLIFEYASGSVDRHVADMLLPYMALAGSGKIKTSEITQHIKTNISVIEKFLPIKFEIDENKVVSCFS